MGFIRRVLVVLLTPAIAILGRTVTTLGYLQRKVRARDEQSALQENVKGPGLEEAEASTGRPADSLQTIIDSLEDEVMVIGPDFRIRQVNKAIRRRLGAVDVVGRPCFLVSHGVEEPCSQSWCECPVRRVLETGQSVHAVHTHESCTEGESEKWVEIVASPLRDNNGHVTEVIELVRDISESKKLQEDILKANRELLALYSIAGALSQSLDLEATLQAVAETMLQVLEAQVSWVQLSDDTGKTPAARASHGLSAPALDKLVEAMSNMSSSGTTTSASYSVMSGGDEHEQGQSLWQFAITPLRSKGVIWGTAGVATAKRPIDRQHIRLLDAIGHQIAVAVERCRLHEEVQLARDLRGELLHQVIATQEEERRRIARELHDEAGQALTALRLCLERLTMTPTSNTGELKARLSQPLSLCQQAEEGVDKVIFDLRPALIDDLGLVEAVGFHAETRLGETGTKLNFKVTGEERRLTGEVEVALFRVMQEGISNIIKHAHANSVVLHLEFKKTEFVARLEDDGCGFEMSQVVSPQNVRHGLGLLGMRERISLVGGSLTITSEPGAGTRLEAIVPLDERESGDEEHQGASS